MSYSCTIRCDECNGTGWLDDTGRRQPCEDCDGHGEIEYDFDCEESIRVEIKNVDESDLVPLLIWVVAEYTENGGLSVKQIEELDGVKALRARLETPKPKRRRAA